MNPDVIAVSFDTPSLIPIEAFTTFGMSAKPKTDSPIGYFGTGLKYAIAVLTRHNIPVSVFIGEEEHIFYTKETNFRGQSFLKVRMKKRFDPLQRWRYLELPYTTELGKNWELWQAYRELEANTRDEGGHTSLTEDVPQEKWPQHFGATKNWTSIVVWGKAFADVHRASDKIFHPQAFRKADCHIQIIDEESSHLYYRGLRVYDLPKSQKSHLTYNIICPTDLTEDRTIKYIYYVRGNIADSLVRQTDPYIIKRVIEALRDPNSFESTLDWEHVITEPSKEFAQELQALFERRQRETSLAPQAALTRMYGYYASHKSTNVVDTRPWFIQAAELIRGNRLDAAWDIIKQHPDALLDWLNILASEEGERPKSDVIF
jgi:hypothetical protein